MKTINGIIFLLVLLITTPVFADYTVDIKDETGTIIKTYTITASQVQHLKKVASRPGGKAVLTQFKEAVLDMIAEAINFNKAYWKGQNEAYIEEQSRQ